MAKPNTYVQLLNAKRQIAQLLADLERMKGFTLQQSLDMAQIALNREFGFGPKYNERFRKAFHDTFIEYARMCTEDDLDDHEIVYTKEKVDRALRAAAGPDILPFDKRYADENLYYRDRLNEPEKGAET